MEVALIVGIILGYLAKTKQNKYNNIVYYGIGLAIIASIVGAFIFNSVAGGFSGRAEEIFEGSLMILGAVFLTTMILWMMQQKRMASELENKVAVELRQSHKLGLFFLVFISVLREGIETVIFLSAASIASAENNLAGAIIGVVAAILLGYVIFLGSVKINIKNFFNVTSILLILFAAGLVAHGVHEFQEAGVMPILVEHVWDINPAVNADGSYPLLHENGYVGSILKGLFGYNGNPSLLEVLSYVVYVVIVFILWKNPKYSIVTREENR